MVWHVYQRALETNIGAENIVIATDHHEIFNAATDFGAQVVMTREDHESGTDRLAEVADIMGWADDVMVVNLQGDEPLIKPSLIEFTAQVLFKASSAGMATLACHLQNKDEVNDPNCVKVVSDCTGKALYFSRAPIPFAREGIDESLLKSDATPWLRHIGMYAYKVSTLKQLSALPVSMIEDLEKLEQLRALWNGIHIQVASIVEAPGHGVDTLSDLERVREIIAKEVR
jgi:3-deoxy-manno-octulosonate cytidylyltransferase (CMP-KDO synthetase)